MSICAALSVIKEREAILVPSSPADQKERSLRGQEWASSPRQEKIKVLLPKANAKPLNSAIRIEVRILVKMMYENRLIFLSRNSVISLARC